MPEKVSYEVAQEIRDLFKLRKEAEAEATALGQDWRYVLYKKILTKQGITGQEAEDAALIAVEALMAKEVKSIQRIS